MARLSHLPTLADAAGFIECLRDAGLTPTMATWYGPADRLRIALDEIGQDVSEAMVRLGWAWALPRYSKDRFLPAQEEAERENRGVWAGHANCEAPARFWQEHRRRDAARSWAITSDTPARKFECLTWSATDWRSDFRRRRVNAANPPLLNDSLIVDAEPAVGIGVPTHRTEVYMPLDELRATLRVSHHDWRRK